MRSKFASAAEQIAACRRACTGSGRSKESSAGSWPPADPTSSHRLSSVTFNDARATAELRLVVGRTAAPLAADPALLLDRYVVCALCRKSYRDPGKRSGEALRRQAKG